MKDNDITLIPELPPEVREAAELGELAIFVGAGVSRIYDCDSWFKLAERLSEECYKKDKIFFREKEHLLSECKTNSKKIITICKNMLEQDDYIEILKKGLSYDKKLGNDNIYQHIYQLSSIGAGLCVTTNIDNLLSSVAYKLRNGFDESRIKPCTKDFNPALINYEHLYHIHGHISKPDSLVLTVPEYLERYKDSNYVSFLDKIFNEYTVLFLGYGLGEFELLEYIAKRVKKQHTSTNKYLLLPLYVGDKNILNVEQKYFTELGIKVVPFQKDEIGHKQLEKVIKVWYDEISQRSKVLVRNYDEIEQLAKSCTEQNGKKILRLIFDESRKDYFFECISEIDNPLDWLKFVYKKGYISPGRVPKPVKDSEGIYSKPWWNALKYLNAIAENAEKLGNDTSSLLINVIKEHFDYLKKQDRTSINQRIESTLFRLIIAIPIDKVTKEHIEYIKFLLNSAWYNYLSDQIGKILLPKLIRAKKSPLVLELFKVAIDYKKIDHNSKLESLLDRNSIQLRKLIDHNLERLCPEYTFECIKILLEKISEVSEKHGNSDPFSVFSINDITNIGPPSYGRGYEKQLVYAIVCLVKKIDKESEIKQLIEILEKESDPIFNRIKYCVFSDHFKNFPKLIWDYVKNNILIGPGENRRERYLFLKNNAEVFDENQVTEILKWIEALDVSNNDENEEQKQWHNAIEKKEWLSALEDVENKQVEDLYYKYNKINPNNRPHPGYYVYYEFGDIKPLLHPSVREWQKLSVENIITNIKRIKTKETNVDKSGNVLVESEHDLTREFEQWVKNDPKKYIDGIQMFIDNNLYLYAIRIIEVVNSSRIHLDAHTWDKFFDIIHNYVNKKHDWSGEASKNRENYQIGFLINSIRLIDKLVKNKKLSNDQMQKIKPVLLICLDRCESTLEYDDVEADIISHFLNSLLGKVLECSLTWINYNSTKDKSDKWNKDFKKVFEKNLNEAKRAREFSVALGCMMPYLCYNDKEWLNKNIDKILPTEEDKDLEWKDTIASVLLCHGIHKNLYNTLRSKKHYSKALKANFYSQEVTGSAIDHICIGYLELQDKDTMNELIKSNKHSNIERAINFFKNTKIKIDAKKRDLIKKFWKDVHETYKESTDKESKGVLYSLVALQIYFDNLSDNEDLLKTSFQNAKFSGFNHNLLEVLLKHIDKEPNIAAELMLETVKSGFCFDHQKRRLRAVVEKLYEHGCKDEAEKVCIHYLEKGNYDLKDIHDKYDKDGSFAAD